MLPQLAWLPVLFLSLVLSLLLSACASNNYAPIRDLERPRAVTKGSYIVRKGDTLYSIAWRYGRDYRELAAANGIRWPYTIFKGQRISLWKRPVSYRKWTPSASVKKEKARPVVKPKPKPVVKPVVKPQPKPVVKATVKPTVNPQPVVKKKAMVWRWPVRGSIIARFSASGSNKGIDIKARAGQSVRAAADGTVVYAGSGLVGYGNLVIIKHSEVFLSAYAHNKKIFVAERKKVKVGERIAEIGSSGASETKLHFEIRKNGKPVNPLWYLPK